jgi:hypothetical protein
VQQVLQDPSGQASGVLLRDGAVIRAQKAVVSNASTWDTGKLLPQGAQLQQFQQQVGEQLACRGWLVKRGHERQMQVFQKSALLSK